ncbi:response regulator transcription factor [Pantoea agglomerans]
MKTIAIYDTNPLIITGLKLLLAQHHYRVSFSTSRPEVFLKNLKLKQPDAVIIDPQFMSEEHLNEINTIKMDLPDLKIVIYAGSESVYHFMTSYGMDYIAYLSKKECINKLILLLENWANERFNPCPNFTGGEICDENQQSMMKHLTPREMEVLRKIGAGKKNFQIAEEMQLSEKTISSHKRRIMKKVNAPQTRLLIDFARDNGF